MERVPTVHGTTNLIDILDRILDKGLVVAGDIRVSLANVELLTIRIRLLVCSVDKAEQIGMNWWKYDPNLTQQVAAPVNKFGLPPTSRRAQATRKTVEAAPIARKTTRTTKKTAVKSKKTRQR
ncbi:MAG TPA: gas vesicle protein [Terriglobales bacterium]|nr:gas vesicle protein [Terriglobales bacterium]